MQQRAIMGTAIALALLLLTGLGIAIVLAPTPQYAANELDPPTAPTWGRPAEPPVRATVAARPGIAGLVDADWLAATAERTGIPERALASYAGAAISKAEHMPSCGLAWNTLAAIGFAESRHGTFGGSSVSEDGTVTPPIFGVSLAGGATEHIPDSDGGVIDGDPEFDRAVGPMQLIPQTWRNWHGEGSGDGVEDPQNLDDAVTSTAAYLCYASGDMASEAGWRSGIAAFNSAESYLRVVAQAADDYR